jgi:hypothetical protein
MNKTVEGNSYDHLLALPQHLPGEAVGTHENGMMIFWQSKTWEIL